MSSEIAWLANNRTYTELRDEVVAEWSLRNVEKPTCMSEYRLYDVLRYGEVLNVPQADERNRVVFREEVPLFDADAYREAIINAFVHNAWIYGNAPMITVFYDRIEILSYGTLPPGQTVEGFFQGQSVPVNKSLSDLILQLHISERTGRGVPRIVEAYGRDCYRFEDNAIVMTIPFHRIDSRVEDEVGAYQYYKCHRSLAQ